MFRFFVSFCVCDYAGSALHVAAGIGLSNSCKQVVACERKACVARQSLVQ